MAQDQATLYLNLSDYGLGGYKSLVDTKYKTAQLPRSQNNGGMTTIIPKVNEDVIASILTHYSMMSIHTEKLPYKKRKK